jgi:hypothetical protein
MKTRVRMPARFMAIYEQAKEEAHQQRLAFIDHRTATLADVERRRQERDYKVKIERTMHIARMRTAERRAR